MKLLLCSSGFTNEKIIAALENLTGKPRANINFAIINEAINGEPGDHRWFAEGLAEIKDNFGGTIEFVDIQVNNLEYARERFEHADVIFCFGGNTNYLADVFRNRGFDKILPDVLNEKVWVGSSAGSCVLCHKNSQKLESEVYKQTDIANEYLNIIPIIFLPHYHSDWYKQLDGDAVIAESDRTNLPIYALSDQAALMVEGENPDSLNFNVVGEDYFVTNLNRLNKSLA